jgi:hypothetical protein
MTFAIVSENHGPPARHAWTSVVGEPPVRNATWSVPSGSIASAGGRVLALET